MKGAGRCLHTVTVFKPILVFLDATKFVLLDDLPKSVLKITAQECKKSTSG